MGESRNAVSRRSTRIFIEEQVLVESRNSKQSPSEISNHSGDENEREQFQGTRTRSTSIHMEVFQTVNLGRDLRGIFSQTMEDMGKHVVDSLEAAKASAKEKVDGKPINFGVVLPGTIYRSSFPQVGDFQYLEGLRLKTVISLVNKDFDSAFKQFMKHNGIRHIVVDMAGTKKVAIPDSTMQFIMQAVLDKANHPILIHCNHGKHRTGCAVAVIRLLSGWQVNNVVEEYRGYAHPKVRECDVEYISAYKLSNLEGLFHKRAKPRGPTLTSEKMARFMILTAFILTIWLYTAICWQ